MLRAMHKRENPPNGGGCVKRNGDWGAGMGAPPRIVGWGIVWLGDIGRREGRKKSLGAVLT
jgi:hypothetical protein